MAFPPALPLAPLAASMAPRSRFWFPPMPLALTDPWLAVYAALVLLAALVAAVWPLVPKGVAATPQGDPPAAPKVPLASMALAGAALIYGWWSGSVQPFDLLVMVWMVATMGLTNRAPADKRHCLTVAGLALAMATGIGSWALARPFLTGAETGVTGLLFGAGLALGLVQALAGSAGRVRRGGAG